MTSKPDASKTLPIAHSVVKRLKSILLRVVLILTFVICSLDAWIYIVMLYVNFFGGARSAAQSKKPRVVRGSGHAHVAMSKLVQVILAERKGFEHLIRAEKFFLNSVVAIQGFEPRTCGL